MEDRRIEGMEEIEGWGWSVEKAKDEVERGGG